MADDVDKTCYAVGCIGIPKPKWSGGTCYIECDVCGRETGVAWSEQEAWDGWDRNRHDDKVRDLIATLRADLAKAVEGLEWIERICREEIPLEYNDGMRKAFQRNIRGAAQSLIKELRP